jgi:hypothetical protein
MHHFGDPIRVKPHLVRIKTNLVFGPGEGYVVMKSSVFLDIMPCSLLKVNQRFRRTRHIHFQSRRISQARNQCEASSKHPEV